MLWFPVKYQLHSLHRQQYSDIQTSKQTNTHTHTIKQTTKLSKKKQANTIKHQKLKNQINK